MDAIGQYQMVEYDPSQLMFPYFETDAQPRRLIPFTYGRNERDNTLQLPLILAEMLDRRQLELL